MINTDLGFQKEAVVTISLPYKTYHKADTYLFIFKETFKKHSEIRGVALGYTPMNDMMWGIHFIVKPMTEEKN